MLVRTIVSLQRLLSIAKELRVNMELRRIEFDGRYWFVVDAYGFRISPCVESWAMAAWWLEST